MVYSQIRTFIAVCSLYLTKIRCWVQCIPFWWRSTTKIREMSLIGCFLRRKDSSQGAPNQISLNCLCGFFWLESRTTLMCVRISWNFDVTVSHVTVSHQGFSTFNAVPRVSHFTALWEDERDPGNKVVRLSRIEPCETLIIRKKGSISVWQNMLLSNHHSI